VTLLRDPVDAFESNYVYMGLEKAFKMDINQFASKKAKLMIPRRAKAIIDKNQQLWDLGLNNVEMEDKTVVVRKIAEFDRQFDLVLIVEQFEESLVLLSDLLCWPLESMTSLKQNERVKAKKSNMTEETRRILREWMWADQLLYDHFKGKLSKQIGSHLQIQEKVLKLRELNDNLISDCVLKRGDNDVLSGEFKMALKIVLGYVVDPKKPWCAPFARSEPNFSKQIRDWQLMRMREDKLKGKGRT